LSLNKLIECLILGTVPQNHTVHNPQPGTPAASVVLDPSHGLPVNDGLSLDSPAVLPQPLAPL
jgi:hypothetical protein